MRASIISRRSRLLSFAITGVLAVTLPGAALVAAPKSRTDPAKGELRLTGRFIKLLVLERQGDDQPLVLESPGSTVLLPEGRYRWEQVALGSAEGSPSFVATSFDDGPWISVTKDKPATLEIGGPLKQEVFATLRGTRIVLSHRLYGIDGHTYNPVDTNVHPKFTIFHNGQPIGSGRLEYG